MWPRIQPLVACCWTSTPSSGKAADEPIGPPQPRLRSRVLRLIAAINLALGLALALVPTSFADSGDLATRMSEGVNGIRGGGGLLPLRETAELDDLARARSLDMASRRYFSHTTPDGLTVFDLMQQRGLRYQVAGENLAWSMADEAQVVERVLVKFLESPPHRANLLDPAFTHLGVGVAAGDGRLYFTLVFVG